jgi:hypothetical protein
MDLIYNNNPRTKVEVNMRNNKMMLDVDKQKDYLDIFYNLLAKLEKKIGGKKVFTTFDGQGAPDKGVYFFFEPEELRSNSITNLRVVRVGTHAIKENANTTLWGRLKKHLKHNQRNSIFRHHIGCAIKNKDKNMKGINSWDCKGWRDVPKQKRDREDFLENKVSNHIKSMPFLFLHVDTIEGRINIEKYAIGLLSSIGSEFDKPSKWLGIKSDNDKIKKSGLWNDKEVIDRLTPKFIEEINSFSFLEKLDNYIDKTS